MSNALNAFDAFFVVRDENTKYVEGLSEADWGIVLKEGLVVTKDLVTGVVYSWQETTHKFSMPMYVFRNLPVHTVCTDPEHLDSMADDWDSWSENTA